MGELPAATRLGAIRLRVGDLERVRAFYEATIGLRALGAENGVAAMGTNGTASDVSCSAPRGFGLSPVRG